MFVIVTVIVTVIVAVIVAVIVTVIVIAIKIIVTGVCKKTVFLLLFVIEKPME